MLVLYLRYEYSEINKGYPYLTCDFWAFRLVFVCESQKRRRKKRNRHIEYTKQGNLTEIYQYIRNFDEKFNNSSSKNEKEIGKIIDTTNFSSKLIRLFSLRGFLTNRTISFLCWF